jgi:precorrin-8X/cobalt-precorrin-8 methylmutase
MTVPLTPDPMNEAFQVDPITAASFRQIDQEIGPHPWQGIPYEVVRRAIHATADFELRDRFFFGPNAVEHALAALRQKQPVIVDVRMVAAGIQSGLKAQGDPPLLCFGLGGGAPLARSNPRRPMGW